MSQKSSDPQAISFVSQPLKRDTGLVYQTARARLANARAAKDFSLIRPRTRGQALWRARSSTLAC